MEVSSPADELLEALRVFAANVKAMLGGPSIAWSWRPAPDTWSLTEVICHLRDVELEVHQSRFRAVLAQENVFIAGVDPDQWAGPRNYRQQDGPAALMTFLEARRQTIALLKGMPAASWDRLGRHAFFGPTTLTELLGMVVRHDAVHWEQLYELVAAHRSSTFP